MDNSSKSKKKIKKRATGDPLPPKQGLFAQLTSENSVRPKKRTRQPSISESSEVIIIIMNYLEKFTLKH